MDACATSPDHLYNRPSGRAEALIDDIQACGKIASDVKARQPYVYSDPKYGVTGQAGAALGAGFAQGMAEARMHNEAVDNCLTARGWSRVALSEADRQRLSATPRTPDARRAFLAEWMASHPAESLRPEAKVP